MSHSEKTKLFLFSFGVILQGNTNTLRVLSSGISEEQVVPVRAGVFVEEHSISSSRDRGMTELLWGVSGSIFGDRGTTELL